MFHDTALCLYSFYPEILNSSLNFKNDNLLLKRNEYNCRGGNPILFLLFELGSTLKVEDSLDGNKSKHEGHIISRKPNQHIKRPKHTDNFLIFQWQK